ncbi:hypothetical protein EJ08DRAFT_663906 [Tothia fuscella]|uniref:Uncharacterized protein n=1 Tax=Tothia fuscella TaxID=1048955 RepID=A0A9P4NKG1_9PEZI|nr:hypothetical protein EJ08DRAFT_663906 [Tothia fuscella]
MAPFSWKKAKDVLTQTEKDRLCCVFLSCIDQVKPTTADYQLGSEEFEAALGGFSKSYQNTLKKLRDNDCVIDTEGGENGDAADKTAAVKTPKKRKGAASKADGEDSPSPKKARTPKKKTTEVKSESAVTAEDDLDNENTVTKAEVDEDGV